MCDCCMYTIITSFYLLSSDTIVHPHSGRTSSSCDTNRGSRKTRFFRGMEREAREGRSDPRARETFQRDNLLVNQNDAWRYKVTRQRTRLTINFNTRQHQILRRCFPRSLPSFPSLSFSLSLSPCLSHPPTPTANAYPSASATVRLMPRSPTTIILGDLRSRSISLTAATNYYPPLNPRHRPTAGAAPSTR